MGEGNSASSRYQRIAEAARERLSALRGGKPRIVVQVGHCGASAGASDLPDAIRAQFGGRASVSVSGCDGACFAAPTVLVECRSGEFARLERVNSDDLRRVGMALRSESAGEPSSAARFVAAQTRVTLDGCGVMDAESVDAYVGDGGYSALARSLDDGADAVIERVKASGLRGRGGAYFPAGLKWEGARNVRAPRRFMIVNCEEGEPGLFKDRHLMEGAPHRILEGALIAAHATDAREIIFYVNAEANLSAERMSRAVEQAAELGLVGDDILGSGFGASVEIRRGAGGYVCGDETTLINTLEGYRREPRLKPPFPTESGLWGLPTVINNAETLASVPFIISEGAERFTEIGDGQDSGTKIISLSGAVRRAGLIEVPFGATLRELIYDFGGGVSGDGELGAIGVGGPSSGVFPPSMLDTAIKPGFLHESGVMLGAGGVIAIDDSLSPLDVVRNLAWYNANESCGKCTPCREGTPRMARMLDAMADGDATAADVEELANLARLVNAASLCGLGQAAGNPALSGLYFFGDGMVGDKS